VDESVGDLPVPSRKMKGSENLYTVKHGLGNLKKYVSV